MFLHIETVRLMGHAGSDLESGYRPAAEIEAQEREDPLLHSAALLLREGVLAAAQVLALDAQLAAIEQVRPGNHWNQPHEAAVKTITRGLLKLGILKGTLANAMKKETYRKFYMHRTGHWLGMDVHDVGDYKVDDQWRMLEPGMTMTIEPGIYVEGWGGVRIEDDVYLGPDGPEPLSDGASTLRELT